MNKIIKSIAFLVVGLNLTLAMADLPTHGFEFNLISDELDELRAEWLAKGGIGYSWEVEGQFVTQLLNQYQEACPTCEITEFYQDRLYLKEPLWEVKFESGLTIQVSIDPGTVELGVGGFTRAEWIQHGHEVQKYVFDLPRSIGFKFSRFGKYDNTAHHNIGVRSAFNDDGRSFARYIIREWQTPELGSGLLGIDSYNAPSLQLLTQNQQRSAVPLLHYFNKSPKPTPEDIAMSIEHYIYTQTPSHEDKDAFHYQLLGLKYITGRHVEPKYVDAPFERRANRHPESMEEVLLQIELQDLQIDYVKRLEKEPLSLTLVPILTGSETLASVFYCYLADAGAQHLYEHFKPILRNDVAAATPFRFLSKRVLWSQLDQPQILEFTKRALTSPFLRATLKERLMEPGAAKNPVAQKILQQWIALAEIKEGEPLFKTVKDITLQRQWRSDEKAKKFRQSFFNNHLQNFCDHVLGAFTF